MGHRRIRMPRWSDSRTVAYLESLGVFALFDGVDEHAGFAARRASILRLADRVLLASAGVPELRDLERRLDAVFDDSIGRRVDDARTPTPPDTYEQIRAWARERWYRS